MDLSASLPPPGDQGSQNSCVGWTVAYALKSFQEHVEERQPLVHGGVPDYRRIFSPAFIYNQINQGRDGGALFVDAFNLLSQQGAAPWSEMPYSAADFRTPPGEGARQAARRFRIDYWRQVNVADIKEVKAQLNAGYPVAIGAIVDDGFHASGPGAIWRSVQGAQRGGHAMLVVGYDDARGAFKLINSWGTRWGDGGYGWIAYDFFPTVVREGYVAKDAANGPGPAPTPSPGPGPAPQPVPQPVPVAQATLTLTNVAHNQFVPGLGPSMVFQGMVSVPAGVRGNVQVVISMRHSLPPTGAPGAPVGSLSPAFATVQGVAATGTSQLPIPPQGLVNAPWTAYFPYAALNVQRGGMVLTPMGPMPQPVTTYLLAEPTVFIDNFGVARTPPVPFFVQL
ncbi:C1 family peptidase [Myxococcus sp. RHSTA-1-4]|uniref:C1 family peptidase n=1 Tax=Myxococcus sp. RHSTA-1-4 TaxID=2874601 RepID=UPI001CBBEC18|nr:C1 family peptidase [Myxococcus sp. RHSTA-1-4]